MTIDEYIISQSEEEAEILKALERETKLKMLRPRMLSGHIQACLLRFIIKMTGAKKILEIGSFTGYSAIAMALSTNDGIVHTIEKNDENEGIINKYIQKSGLQNKLKLHIGDALSIIPTLGEAFDMVYIDADKRQYKAYYDMLICLLKPGGIIVADDVLWNDKVLDANKHNDPQTLGILEFNEFVKRDDRVENIILPIRHGINLIRKKQKYETH